MITTADRKAGLLAPVGVRVQRVTATRTRSHNRPGARDA